MGHHVQGDGVVAEPDRGGGPPLLADPARDARTTRLPGHLLQELVAQRRLFDPGERRQLDRKVCAFHGVQRILVLQLRGQHGQERLKVPSRAGACEPARACGRGGGCGNGHCRAGDRVNHERLL
jgi:hypothetical protein